MQWVCGVEFSGDKPPFADRDQQNVGVPFVSRMWVSPLFALREADATSISPHDGKAVLGEE